MVALLSSLLLATVLIPAQASAVSATAKVPSKGADAPDANIEYSFNIWNWNIAWRDYELFKSVVDQAHELGFNTIELGVPWNSVETVPGKYDFSEVDKRVEYVARKGLDIRLRVNVQDYPTRLDPELMERPDGTTDLKNYGDETGIPSFFNENNLSAQTRWVRQVASHYSGSGFEYTLGIGVHFELKYGGWYNYEASSKAAFWRWLTDQYGTLSSLNSAWRSSYSSFGEIQPPVPASTPRPGVSAQPDTSTRNADWIRFRDESLAKVVSRYYKSLRLGDPSASISSPLGESFRSGSAEMGNQDVHGLSRGADNIVTSYDFFIHGPDGLWNLSALVTAYRGISNLPVKVELDGYSTYQKYGEEGMFQAGVTALEAGAQGLNVANYTQQREWAENLAQFGFMERLGNYIERLNNGSEQRPPVEQPEILLYLSKWTQYNYRAPSEWIHDYQFGFLRLLLDQNIPVRVVTDENILHERLNEYAGIILPFNVVVDDPVRGKMRHLLMEVPALQDMSFAEFSPTAKHADTANSAFGATATAEFADAATAVVEDTSVLSSFVRGEEFRLRGLGQPTDSQRIYVRDTATASATSSAGPVVWANEQRARSVTLGYNAGLVYTKGGYKNQTRDVVLDALKWMGLELPERRDVPDFDPPIADFALESATARIAVLDRTPGLRDGAEFRPTADGEDLVLGPPSDGVAGRTVVYYDVSVPTDNPVFRSAIRLDAPGGDGSLLSVVAVEEGGTVVPLAYVPVNSVEPRVLNVSLAEVAGKDVQLGLYLDSGPMNDSSLDRTLLRAPRVEGDTGAATDLVGASTAAAIFTETRTDGLNGGAEFYNVSESSIKFHPPWSGSTGAVFAAYEVELPADEPGEFTATVRKEQPFGDGVWFSLIVVDQDGTAHRLVLTHVTEDEEVDVSADLEEFAGQVVQISLGVDSGPAGSPAYDGTLVNGPKVTASG